MSSEMAPALIAEGAGACMNSLGPASILSQGSDRVLPDKPQLDYDAWRQSLLVLPDKPQLDYDAWRQSLQDECARYNPEGVESGAFKGWIRTIDVCGFKALDAGWNAGRLERDHRDARLDGADHYFVLAPLSGPLLVTQNDQATPLSMGDVVLLDATRPLRLLFEHDLKEPLRHLALNLPREELAAHLGFELQGGLVRPDGIRAGHLLFELIQNTSRESESLSSDSYMRLVVYDLIGALFCSPERSSASRYADKLFARVRDIIRQGYADPDFGPPEAAARAGISLRYLQKLFTQRDATCSDFIYSLRLDRAAQLLQRRESVRSDQPLSEIAYAAARAGFKTAFIKRPDERGVGKERPAEPTDFKPDYTAASFEDLADQLGCPPA